MLSLYMVIPNGFGTKNYPQKLSIIAKPSATHGFGHYTSNYSWRLIPFRRNNALWVGNFSLSHFHNPCQDGDRIDWKHDKVGKEIVSMQEIMLQIQSFQLFFFFFSKGFCLQTSIFQQKAAIFVTLPGHQLPLFFCRQHQLGILLLALHREAPGLGSEGPEVDAFVGAGEEEQHGRQPGSWWLAVGWKKSCFSLDFFCNEEQVEKWSKNRRNF